MMDALRLLDDAEIARAYGFTPREVRYVLWHVDPDETFTPSDSTIAAFLTELHDGLADIRKNPTAIDSKGDVTKTYFTKLFGSSGTALVTQAMGIVDGTAMSGASGFITTYFAPFMNLVDALAKLVTGPGLLATAAERFAYVQPFLQTFVDGQTRVIDRLATTLSLTNAAADVIARTYVHARTSGGGVDSTKSALTLLSGIDSVATPITLGSAAPYWYTFLHLHKVGTVVSRLKLADSDLDWTFNHGPVALDALPVVAASSTTAFADWSRLVRAATLRDRFVDKALFDIFSAAWVGGSSLGAVLSDVADRTGWSLADLTYLAANLSPAITYPNDFKDERALVRVARAMDVVSRMGLPAQTVLPWADPTNGDTTTEAAAIKAAVRGTFSAETWPAAVKPVRDALRERQRDAMVSYLVGTSTTFTEPVDLADDLLMDVEVASCARTSRIKQAISSTQTFIQRVFLNFEPSVVFTTDDARKWEWMRAFRLWEANRKIFLYPENWIEPTLRDDKSELFERLETDLSKGELNDELIEEALLAYLHGLEEISHLDPIATTVDDDPELNQSRLHVVARTKAHPPVHYFRTRETSGRWLGWRKMDVDIPSDHVLLAMYNRRPYVVWTQVTKRASDAKVSNVEQYELRLQWTSLRRGKWGKTQQSKDVLQGYAVDPKELAPQLGLRFASRYTIDANDDLVIRYVDFDKDGNEPTGFAPNNSSTVNYFRITGGQGIAIKDSELWAVYHAVASKRVLAPNGDPVANLFKRSDAARLELPDVFNSYSKQKSQMLEVLSFTPSVHWLTTGGALDDEWAAQPMFLSDSQRCFLIVPTRIVTLPTAVPPVPSAPPADTTQSVVLTWANMGSLVNEKLDFAQDPSSGGTTYSAKLLNSLTVASPLPTRTAYTFSSFHHPFVRNVVTQLNRLGIERMFDPQPGKPGEELRRQSLSTPYFSAKYFPTNWVTTPYPVDDFDFTPEAAFSLYNWELFFHIPLLIATKLAANQQFEQARKWFHFIFNPTETKSPTAAPGTEEVPQRFWKVKPFFSLTAKETAAEGPIQMLKLLLSHDDKDPARLAARKLIQQQVEEWRENPFEPHRIARLRPVAYMKTTVIKYLDMLLAWGDQLFARSTLESINEALQIYIIAYRVLGKRPTKLPAATRAVRTYHTIASTLDEFSDALLKIETALPPVNDDVEVGPVDEAPTDQPSMLFCVPPNEKLLGYWDTIEDRLYKIRHCLNLQGVAVNLPLFEPPIDPGLLVKARAAGIDIGSILDDVSSPRPIHRYAVYAQRATELTNEVKSLGQAFLSALEKKDAEELALLRAGQEIQVMQAMRVSRAQAVVDAQRAREALERSREAATARKEYYATRSYMNTQERDQVEAAARAAEQKLAAEAMLAVAGVLQAIPNFDVGVSGFSPHATLVTGGTQLANMMSINASVLGVFATWNEGKAQLAGLQASFQRRADEWVYQAGQAELEIKSLDKQIAAAEIREAIAESDLETQDLQIQNAIDVRDFMRDKFTNVALYDHMVSQLAATYFQAFKLAYDAAKRAELAWKFEIYEDDPTKLSFITFGYWDGLRKGLLAGEMLALDIKRMEMAYLDKNVRDFELVRHLPLTALDPLALQQLRETGTATVAIPESVFDADSAGHYFRRLRNVSVTIAGVTGPYTSVRCTLTLLGSSIRRKANLVDPLESSNVPVQSIVTSSARDDGGLFETNLRDERYLPFEGAGAISTWRIELPNPAPTSALEGHSLPVFDYRTISELVLHLRSTARDGGSAFRQAVNASAGPLNGVTWKVGFSVKNVFSDEWYKFLSSTGNFVLKLDGDHIPFRGANAKITAIQFIRVQKTIVAGIVALGISPAPLGGSPLNLTSTPSVLNGQATGTATYANQALGNWTISGTVANFTADDDLFVIVSYLLPAAP